MKTPTLEDALKQEWTVERRSSEPGHEWFMLSINVPVKNVAEADRVRAEYLQHLTELRNALQKTRDAVFRIKRDYEYKLPSGDMVDLAFVLEDADRVLGPEDAQAPQSRFSEQDREDEAESAKRAGYRAKDYTGEKCTNCGRNRVMNCDNGKHVCEKCGWDADANQYDPGYHP